MKPKHILKQAIYKGKKLFGPPKKDHIVKFKKEIWQTDDISKAFINGSDSKAIVVADIMDKEVNDFFLSNCSPNDKVLDIGCGHGIVSEYLAERGIHVAAMDISEKLLDEFKTRIANRNLPIEISRGDAYNTPYKDGQFDVVVARMFLPHFPDWPVVLKEMARVTKRNGKLLVHFSSAENTALGKEIGSKNCEFGSSPDTADPWKFYAETDNKELQKVCSSMGLKVVQRTPVSFFLHNRILGYQLGHDAYHDYMRKVQEYFQDEKVKEFVIWFDKEIISRCSPALSHFNIITITKI